jgi:hypothetical protein
MDAFSNARNQFFGTYIAQLSHGIEIGPSYRPTFSKSDGYQTFVIDVQDQLSLVSKYSVDPNINEEMIKRIESVDLVWDGATPLSGLLKVKYDWLVACHVIEHQTCLISFLQDIGQITSNEGKLLLAVPSRDLMFDYYRPVSTIGDVVTAKMDSRSHNLKARVDELFYTSLLAGLNAWSTDFAESVKIENIVPEPCANPTNLQTLLAKIISDPWEDSYVDRHRWVFTPKSFEALISILHQVGLSPWQIESVQPGIDCEFMAVLKKSNISELQPLEMERLFALNSSTR